MRSSNRMYAPFAESSGGATEDPFPSDVQMAPLLSLADKYNMIALLKGVESAFVRRLKLDAPSKVRLTTTWTWLRAMSLTLRLSLRGVNRKFCWQFVRRTLLYILMTPSYSK